jgi:hypothetical protein
VPTLRVLNVSFDLTLPYAAGAHTLTVGEAAVLNRARTQAIAALARKAVSSARSELREPSADALAALAANFTFPNEPYVLPPDPQTNEAQRIAKSLVREALTKRGETEQGIGRTEFERLCNEVAATPRVRDEANRRVLATQRVATATLSLTDDHDLLG